MNIQQFNAVYVQSHLCQATYLNGSDQVVQGIVVDDPKQNHKKQYLVPIDSKANRIPLHRILKVTKSARRWADL